MERVWKNSNFSLRTKQGGSNVNMYIHVSPPVRMYFSIIEYQKRVTQNHFVYTRTRKHRYTIKKIKVIDVIYETLGSQDALRGHRWEQWTKHSLGS
jgi:hypothetical protein